MITMLEQKRQGFNDSSVSVDAAYNNRMQYPSTPQDFRSFDSLKELRYDGNILTSKERSGLYNDHIKVILEMAESYNIFSRCIYFNPAMTEKCQKNTNRYIKYYTNIIRQIDIYLQEDQLMCTKQAFPLVPVPSYLPNIYELGHNDVRQIDDRASTEVRRVENKMMVIMQEHQEREQHDISHNSFHSSFSRIRSQELNDMGYGLSRISPITFDDDDAFQMPSNRAKDRGLISTPRKMKNEANTGSTATTQTPHQDGNAKSYNANLSVAGTGSNKPSGRFVPPKPNNTGSSSQEMDNSNTTTVYYEKSNGEHQNKSTSIQMLPENTISTRTITTTQTTNQKALQVGGTQTTPPPPRKSTSTGETQTSPPKDKPHRQVGLGSTGPQSGRSTSQCYIKPGQEDKEVKCQGSNPSWTIYKTISWPKK